MSNYWDLHCVTCGVDGNVIHWNHGEDRLVELIKVLPAIATLGDAMTEHLQWVGLSLSLSGPEWASGLIEFAQEHRGHVVRPRSEYGYLFGDCAESFPCTCCSHRLTCRLPQGHPGPHSQYPPPSPAV